jgi:hypothetical protein
MSLLTEIERVRRLIAGYQEELEALQKIGGEARYNLDQIARLQQAIADSQTTITALETSQAATALETSQAAGASTAMTTTPAAGGTGLTTAAEGVTLTTRALQVFNTIGRAMSLTGPTATVAGGTTVAAAAVIATIIIARLIGGMAADKPVEPGMAMSRSRLSAQSTKAPSVATGTITTGALPSSMTIKHRKDLLWPLTLNFIKQEPGGAGRYEGKGFDGTKAFGTLILLEEGRFSLSVTIPSKSDGEWRYDGRRSGNSAEGDYYPPSGFGPVSYFKAEW